MAENVYTKHSISCYNNIQQYTSGTLYEISVKRYIYQNKKKRLQLIQELEKKERN